MKTLYVLRHGKAQDWRADGDKARELTPRGMKDARATGAALVESGRIPDVVLSSDAIRAAQTARIACEECGCGAKILWRPEIYEASLSTLIGLIHDLPPEAQSALMVGHNPGFEALVKRIASGVPDFFTLKTACMAEIKIEGDWRSVQNNSGELARLLEPGSK